MGDIRCPDCGTVNNEFVSASRVNGIERKSYTCKPCSKIFKLISDKTPKELESDEKFDEYVSEVNSTTPCKLRAMIRNTSPLGKEVEKKE